MIEQRTKAYFQKKFYGQHMPVPSKKAENKELFGQNSELALVPWEVNQIKPLFKKYDGDKKGVTREDVCSLMTELQDDLADIGKVPYVNGNEYAPLFSEWSEPVAWETFRDFCNTWEWRMTDSDKLQKTVDEYFAKAYKFKMQGKDEESKAMTTKALRL